MLDADGLNAEIDILTTADYTIKYIRLGRVAQGQERVTHIHEVAGSIPAAPTTDKSRILASTGLVLCFGTATSEEFCNLRTLQGQKSATSLSQPISRRRATNQ